MYESLLPLLRCPECKGGSVVLAGEAPAGEDLLEGELRCSACDRSYALRNGIPCLLPDKYRDVGDGDVEEWARRRKQAEQGFLDEDMETYRNRFLDEAVTEGLDPDTDAFLWEQRLYRDTIQKFEKDWEAVPEKGGLKWVRPAETEHDRNARAVETILGLEAGSLEGCTVLNMGPGGDTNLVERLEATGARVVNVDIVAGPLEHLRALAPDLHRQGVNGDLRSLPFQDGAFDAVCSAEVVHHVQPIQPAVAELVRVLKPGKRLYLIEPNGKHLLTYPGKVIPTFLKRWIRIGLRRIFGSKERYLQGSPYERITPIPAFVDAMAREGMVKLDKDVLTHAPEIFPGPIVRLWTWLGRTFPSIFEPVALEFLLWGEKPAARG